MKSQWTDVKYHVFCSYVFLHKIRFFHTHSLGGSTATGITNSDNAAVLRNRALLLECNKIFRVRLGVIENHINGAAACN